MNAPLLKHCRIAKPRVCIERTATEVRRNWAACDSICWMADVGLDAVDRLSGKHKFFLNERMTRLVRCFRLKGLAVMRLARALGRESARRRHKEIGGGQGQ